MAQQLFHEYGLYPIHAAAAVATAAKFARAPDRGTERAGTVNAGAAVGRGDAVLSKLLR